MGLFSQTEQEAAVDNATTSSNTSENWDKILEVCDKAGKTADEARIFLKLIVKKLYDADPHVQVQAATLLDACVKNSGKVFLLEVASSQFENDYFKLVTNTKNSHPDTIKKLKESLKKWSEGEFKNDPELGLIPSLYHKLQSKGITFPSETHNKKTVHLSKDPNVVQSQDEEDQIAKAIELSLKETSNRSPRVSSAPNLATSTAALSLYPTSMLSSSAGCASISGGGTAAAGSSAVAKEVKEPVKEPRKVRALYDFEAAEDNELTFVKGELILVLDDSDANWWRGSNHRGEGLFPSNFVTSDLSAEPELEEILTPEQDTKSLDEALEEKLILNEPENVVINEGKIDRLLHLLHEADPTDPNQDTKEMLTLEKEVNVMGPMIDAELERVDRKHAQLTQLSTDLVDAMNLYHTLMREPPLSMKGQFAGGYPQPPQSMMYNGVGPPSSMAHFPQHPSMMMGPPTAHGMYELPPGAMAAGSYMSMAPGSLPPGMHPQQQSQGRMPPQQQHQQQPQQGHMMRQQGPLQQQQPQVSGTDEQQHRLVQQQQHQQQQQQQSQGGASVPQQFSPPPHHGGMNMGPVSFPLQPMSQNAIMNGPPQGTASIAYSAMSHSHIM